MQAVAEALPLRDNSVDAALAVLTVHHWRDLTPGVAEMRRVARRRLVFFTWRPDDARPIGNSVDMDAGQLGRPARKARCRRRGGC